MHAQGVPMIHSWLRQFRIEFKVEDLDRRSKQVQRRRAPSMVDFVISDASARLITDSMQTWAVSENRVTYFGVLVIRILLFRVLY